MARLAGAAPPRGTETEAAGDGLVGPVGMLAEVFELTDGERRLEELGAPSVEDAASEEGGADGPLLLEPPSVGAGAGAGAVPPPEDVGAEIPGEDLLAGVAELKAGTVGAEVYGGEVTGDGPVDDPAGGDPAGIDPAGIDPMGTVPAGGDPAGKDPAGIDPEGIDPGGGPAGTDPVG